MENCCKVKPVKCNHCVAFMAVLPVTIRKNKIKGKHRITGCRAALRRMRRKDGRKQAEEKEMELQADFRH